MVRPSIRFVPDIVKNSEKVITALYDFHENGHQVHVFEGATCERYPNIEEDEKIPDYYDYGGGFGNTRMLDKGTIITPYSYLYADTEVDELLRTGKFLEKETFYF